MIDTLPNATNLCTKIDKSVIWFREILKCGDEEERKKKKKSVGKIHE